MLASRYKLLVSRTVTRRWPMVLAAWLAIALLLRWIAPSWTDVAADGDLAFLPENVPSAVGLAALEEAFPGSETRSQMVMVFADRQQPLNSGDVAYALDVTRRLHWMAAESAWQKLVSVETPQPVLLPAGEDSQLRSVVLSEIVRDNLTEAIEIEEELSRFLGNSAPEFEFKRLPNAYERRGQILNRMGIEPEQAQIDLDTAQLLSEQQTPLLPKELPEWFSQLRDVWSWRNAIVGHKLGSNEKHARLVTLQLTTDFTATSNISMIAGLERLARNLRELHHERLSSDLKVEISGSAAVGADMLRAAQSGVRKTELVTVLLVLLILASVYRAPFLVAVPLTSIALSLIVATSLVALLARDPADPDSWGLGVFTTTRIFIVVLLFGAGTDFCLFFLARSREELQREPQPNRRAMQRVVTKSWLGVHDALLASAVTTIVGLGLMWFSRFEKFQFSGPIIAISLAVTLVVCLTFTPALLSGLGTVAFWPLLRKRGHKQLALDEHRTGDDSKLPPGDWRSYWAWLADFIVARPALCLFSTLAVLSLPAAYGIACIGSVTYDLADELSKSAPSRRGARLISEYFPTQAGSPITVLLQREQPFASEEALRAACDELAQQLYTDRVDSVRSLTDPLGDYPPGKRMSLFAKDAWRRRILLNHRITKEHYVSPTTQLALRVARFDIVLADNPFSLAASATLSRIRELIDEKRSDPDSAWHDAIATTSGTTVGITDLRQVTQEDQRRIQILVTLGVWLVLIVLLRRPLLSTYLIFTVLFSYFATLGITYGTFQWLYGPTYSGLDWKVPLFLFVILVAVGQDYNVYLVTRIFEEQRAAGLTEGVRRALTMTGGIITSCGLVMAGTFVAMTSPAVFSWLAGVLPAGWLADDAPVLRGITELGFALACGVLLDTLIVRSILVPAFVLLWQRRDAATR